MRKGIVLKRAIGVFTVMLLSVCLISCGSKEDSNLSDIQKAMDEFAKLQSGTLIETFIGSETTTYEDSRETDYDREDTKCTLQFENIGAGCNFTETTYSYFDDGNYGFYAEKQQDGVKFTATSAEVLKDESQWKRIKGVEKHYGIHPIMEYMEYLPPTEFISEDFKISQEGDLTRYDLSMNDSYINGVADTYNSDAVYTAEKRNMSYWIDSKGILVKHSNEVVDRMEWNGKIRERSISKTVELTDYKI